MSATVYPRRSFLLRRFVDEQRRLLRDLDADPPPEDDPLGRYHRTLRASLAEYDREQQREKKDAEEKDR